MNAGHWIVIVAVGGGAIWSIICEYHRRKYFRKISGRSDSRPDWALAVPNVPEQAVLDFLRFFADCFSISEKYVWKLRPTDTLSEVYQTLHPPKWSLNDNLEFEILQKWLRNKKQFDLRSVWHEQLTLSELFTRLSECAGKSEAAIVPQQQANFLPPF